MIYILRFVHIVAGVLWVGGSVMLAFFVAPAIGAVGPAGGQVMRELMQVRKLPIFLSAMGPLVLISGIWLFYIASGGWQTAYMGSGPGRGFGFGAVAAILAAIVGMGMAAPTGAKMAKLGAAMQSGPPSAEQIAEMKRLQARLNVVSKIASVLLLIATTAMAVARYL